MWIQNLARILQDSCKISHSKGVDEKSHLFSVLLIKNSDISHDIWFSVSFSYQKHINIFSKIYSLLTSWAGQFRYQMKTTNTEKTYIQYNDTMFGQIGRVDQEKLSETISEPKKIQVYFNFFKFKHW